MSKDKSIVVKLCNAHFVEGDLISRCKAELDVRGLFKILNTFDLKANPREAEENRVTRDIQATLQTEEELFTFMNKGLLIMANDMEELDRGRWQLFIKNPKIEGLCDGGHTTFATARHLIKTICGDEAVDGLRDWQDLSEVWHQYSDALLETGEDGIVKLDKFKFRIPIEIQCPGTSENALLQWGTKAQQVNNARNANVSLPAEAKANQKGFFSYISKVTDPVLQENIEWKSGTKGHISPRELCVLALIPASLISEDHGVKINPPTLYASKATALQWFTELCKKGSKLMEDGTYELEDKLLKSAFKLGVGLTKIFDDLQAAFPELYNNAGGKFGRVGCVDFREGKKPWKTKFYQRDLNYKYPEAFLIPLMWSLKELMFVEDDEVKWKVDDINVFLKENMQSIFDKLIYPSVSGDEVNFNPQTYGKAQVSYNNACLMMEGAYNKMRFVEAGLS